MGADRVAAQEMGGWGGAQPSPTLRCLTVLLMCVPHGTGLGQCRTAICSFHLKHLHFHLTTLCKCYLHAHIFKLKITITPFKRHGKQTFSSLLLWFQKALLSFSLLFFPLSSSLQIVISFFPSPCIFSASLLHRQSSPANTLRVLQ